MNLNFNLEVNLNIDLIGFGSNLLTQMSELYQVMIDPADQVSIDYILQWFKQPNLVPRDVEDFKNFANGEEKKPCHVFVGASVSQTLVGFLYAIYDPISKIAFVSYVAVRGQHQQNGIVTKCMFNFLQDLSHQADVDCNTVFFEISQPQLTVKRAAARRRLFSRYLESMGLTAFRLDFDYTPPSLNPEGIATDFDAKADLYLVPVGNQNHINIVEPKKSVSRESLITLVHAIYFNIYADVLAQGNWKNEYLLALEKKIKHYKKNLPDEILLLT